MSTSVPSPKRFPPPAALGIGSSPGGVIDTGNQQPGTALQPYVPPPAPAPTASSTPATSSNNPSNSQFDPTDYTDIWDLKNAMRNRRKEMIY